MDTDVAIAGAGFAGLALASFAADSGLSVVVHERRPSLEPEGIALQLQPNGLEVLAELGVLDEVLARGHRIERVEQFDDSGRLRATIRYDELDHPHPFMCGIRRHDLLGVLAARLPESVEVRTGSAVAGADELRAGARLAVAADGAGSKIRDSLGAKRRMRTGPAPYLIGISDRMPFDDVGRIYCGRGWCNGVLPYGERTYFFDCVTEENADAVERRDIAAWRDVYAARVPEGEEIAASIGSFDDLAQLSGRTHWTSPRVFPRLVLIGDAAAAVHPHSGQGANQALTDARALGRALAEAGPDDVAAIEGAMRRRSRETRVMVPWSIVAGRALDGTSPGWRAVRRLSYATLSFGPVRRNALRRQAGLA